MTSKFTGGFAAVVLLISSSGAMAQATAPASAAKAAPAANPAAATRRQNVHEYIKLLREDVRKEKAKVLGGTMQLDADQATKFWPIYKEYDAQLAKLNDLRAANIGEYAKAYSNMTDTKADELVNGAISYQKKRTELLANYYDKVRLSLGTGVAARFVQVESQLLNIIDLQIQSELPLIWAPPPKAASKP
jgi:hypothetical protein